MEEKDNKEPKEQNIEKKIADAAKDAIKNAAKEKAKEMATLAAKAIVSLIVSNLPIIVTIIAIIILTSGLIAIKDKMVEIATDIGSAISSFLGVGEQGPLIQDTKTMIESINNQLDEMGINKKELNMGNEAQTDAYLYKFMTTALSTSLPYIKNSPAKTMKEIIYSDPNGEEIKITPTQAVQGIVKIKRRGIIEKELEYIKHDVFLKLIENKDTSVLDYFSIDDSWMLCVAKTTETITTGHNGITSDTIIDEVKIPYQTMISKYNVPFEFFMALHQITLNPEYVSAVADLIQEQGEIELTIFDSKQTIINEYEYRYKIKEKWLEEVEVEKEKYDIEDGENSEQDNKKKGTKDQEDGIKTTKSKNPREITTSRFLSGTRIARKERPEIIESGLGTSDDKTSTKVEETNQGTNENNNDNKTDDTQTTETKIVTKTSVGDEQVEKTKTITQITSVTANITKANVLVIKQEATYNINTDIETPYGENGLTTEIDDEEEPSGDEGEWKVERSETTKETIEKEEWKLANSKVEIDEDKFLGLWRNKTGTYKEGASYVSKEDGGKEVEYRVPGTKYTKEAPIENILNAEDWLYTLLERSETTQMQARLMRYLIHFYKTGEKIDISELISIFNTGEFTEGSYNGAGFDVHDEDIFITDIETLKKALSAYSDSSKLIQHAQELLDMQNKYKVNALFAASVCIAETGGGNTGNAINYTGRVNPKNGKKYTAVGSYDGEMWNNWFNQKTTSSTHYGIIYNGEGESHYRIFPSVADSIDAFGDNIANGSYYYKANLYTVSAIGHQYCPNSPAYPTQGDDWTNSVISQMSKFYSSAGIDVSEYINATGGMTAAGGQGYRGVYTTASGKSFVEYLQYSGPWAENKYANGTMHHKGCSVTSVAVILSGYGIDKNPEDIRPKNGTMISISGVLEQNGLIAQRINKPSATQVLDHLNNGDAVIIYAGGKEKGYSGTWSDGTGHYFPVLEANGTKAYVSNVGSSTKTGWYDINTILKDNIQVIFVSK